MATDGKIPPGPGAGTDPTSNPPHSTVLPQDAFGGGSGSAFAHLAEEGGYVVADAQVHAPFFGSGAFETFAAEFAYLQTGDIEVGGVGSNPVFLVWTAGDAQERFHVRADGSLRWGNGAGSPDTSLQRAANGGLLVADPDDDGFYVAAEADHSTSYVWLGGDGTVAIVNATAQQQNIIVDADGDLAIAGVGKIAIQP